MISSIGIMRSRRGQRDTLGIMPWRALGWQAGWIWSKLPPMRPPVYKLMDYDKHRFEQAKREKEKISAPFRQGSTAVSDH